MDNAQVWLVGSRMYGLHNPDSDFDYIAVTSSVEDIVDPLADAFRSGVSEQTTVHTVSKFARLLAKGNPTIVDLVYHAPEKKDPFVNGLVSAVKPLAITQEAARSYVGYLSNQVKRGFQQSSAHGVRPEHHTLGYDPKYITHCLRLVFQLRGIYDTGGYHYLTDYERDFLKYVRSGAMNSVDALAVVKRETENIDKLNLDSLPDAGPLREAISGYFISHFAARLH